jgi:hypothetical protein
LAWLASGWMVQIRMTTPKKRPGKFIDRHTQSRLEWFGLFIYKTLNDYPYLVGSSLYKKDFRDIDLRVIVGDDRFKELYGDENDWRDNALLEAANLAFSALAKEMTGGLPIDFQFQQQTDANNAKENDGKARNPLGVLLNVREHREVRENEPRAPKTQA